uniref:Uncharacterized protein LOC105637945 n=1 Tax=Rhizophora mucronata TaxID=61149 RepID=A0A2P2PA04_RHIMU
MLTSDWMPISCLRAVVRPHFFSTFAPAFSSPKRHLTKTFPISLKPYSSTKMSATPPATQIIEHIVLFKVKDNTDSTKVNSMITSLNGLISLDPVLHLTAGALHRIRSSHFAFTHMLHSRYSSKENLNAYTVHPSHVGVVKESVRPICDDIMAVDWVADDLQGPVAPPPGSPMRVTFLKLKDNQPAEAKDEIIGVIRGIKQRIGGIDQITCGENFSPARAKGYSIASLAVFPGLSELDAVDSKEELVNSEKAKVRDSLESVLVLDYVVPSSGSSSL